MRKKRVNMARKSGLPPGTLLHVGKQYIDDAQIHVIDYNLAQVIETELHSVQELASFHSADTMTWIHVKGLQNIDLIEEICQSFGVHPLVQEDILNTAQRPKLEDYGEYLFVVLKNFWGDKETGVLASEQISILFGASYVLSFQESDRDLFESIRNRINSSRSRLRRQGADYLAYALTDIIVDNYFVILEALGEKIELLEEDLVAQSGADSLKEIHSLKRQMLLFRKAVWPLRETIGSLSRGDSPLVQDSTLLYIRDVYDHTIQAIDTLETYRDIVSGMLDIYLSSISNHMNQVMKVLTVISTIFIPLTFIVGVYGMNFKYMPELEWEWGYPAVWLLMLFVFLGMLQFFRTRKWL
jgi:magnesium transporter